MSLGELKAYLGIDGEEQNSLLSVFNEAAEHIVEKVIRVPITDDMPPVIKSAILYIVWQLYFHRDDNEFKASNLESTVAVMLSDIRKQEF